MPTKKKAPEPARMVKTAADPAIYLVEDGQRRHLATMADVYAAGLLPIEVISPEALEEIPEAPAP